MLIHLTDSSIIIEKSDKNVVHVNWNYISLITIKKYEDGFGLAIYSLHADETVRLNSLQAKILMDKLGVVMNCPLRLNYNDKSIVFYVKNEIHYYNKQNIVRMTWEQPVFAVENTTCHGVKINRYTIDPEIYDRFLQHAKNIATPTPHSSLAKINPHPVYNLLDM